MMKNEKVLCGVKVGEHARSREDFLQEIRDRVLPNGFDYVCMRPQKLEYLTQEDYGAIASCLAENGIRFFFSFKEQMKFQQKNPDVDCQFEPETVEAMAKNGGECFLGNCCSEPGTATACNFAGYYRNARNPERGFRTVQRMDCRDVADAHDSFLSHIQKFVRDNRAYGMPNLLVCEATALSKYSLEAGVDFPMLEVMNGNPDEMLPSVRGAARGYGAKKWFVLIAHEWYGGRRHADPLKRKRLELAWKFCYLSGANGIMLESGDGKIKSYGQKYDRDSEICGDYQRMLSEMTAFCKKDARPLGGPKVKLAFVSGRYDSWGGFCGSSAWNQFHREEWGYGPAEYSWRLLDELGTRRKWGDVNNYGQYDFSAGEAYDIIPIESSVEALCAYDRLIFLGWNTMTDEDMDKLTEYVRRGGKLLMTAAHLNYSTARKGNLMLPPQEKMEALFGCRFTGRTLRTNSGTKFRRDSLDEGVSYPGCDTFMCDPLFSAGYTEFLETEATTAVPQGFLSDTFWGKQTDGLYTVLENKVGSGVATLVTATSYPGDPALYPMYRAMAREWVSASAATGDIRVIGGDRLRWAAYEGGRLYLLNTDYDLPITVKILRKEKEETLTLEPLELRVIPGE